MFGSLLGVVMNAIFLSYVKKLEHDKCECAEDKLRAYTSMSKNNKAAFLKKIKKANKANKKK